MQVPSQNRTGRPAISRSFLVALILLLLVFLALNFSIAVPTGTSVHTDMKTASLNAGMPARYSPKHGCGTYRAKTQVGYGVGTTIQLAAGICWNGKKVWWTWGLTRGDCRPDGYQFTQVQMTCQINGEGNNDMLAVSYQARVTSSLLPFVSRTVSLDLLVTSEGYVLQP